MKWLSLRTRVIRGDSLRKELRVVDRTVRCLAVTQKQAYALGVRIPRYPPNIGNASPCGVSTKNSTNLITKEISMNKFDEMQSNTIQFTKEEAVTFTDKNLLKDITPLGIFKLQMSQKLLCMDFSTFQEATEKVLDRGVWTHEFAKPELLWDEYLGNRVFSTHPLSTWNEVTST